MKNYRRTSILVKYRKQNFKIGMIVAILCVFYAFNVETEERVMKFNSTTPTFEDEIINIPRTSFNEKPIVTPPKIEITKIEEIVDEVEFIDEPVKKALDIEDVIVADKPQEITNVVPEKRALPVKLIPQEIIEDVDPIFVIVEEMPRFAGCEDLSSKKERKACSSEKLLSYIYSQIKYPTIAKETTIEGTVVVSFVINKEGVISDVKVKRDIGGGCGQEVLRIVKKMPKWVAGKQRGKPVSVQFNLPVKFKLS